jgi:hypothetical protein
MPPWAILLHHPLQSDFPPKRPVQQRLEQVLRLALGFALLGVSVTQAFATARTGRAAQRCWC